MTRNRTVRLTRPGALSAALVAGLVAAALLVIACSSSGSASISVTGAWVRATPASAGSGAAYLTIQNTGSAADALVGASSPVATTLEVHETMVMDSPAPSASTAMGSPMASTSGEMMGMQPVARLGIPAGGTVQLAPGGYHLMLIGLTKDLNVGDTVQVTLKFEKAGDVTVTAQVRVS